MSTSHIPRRRLRGVIGVGAAVLLGAAALAATPAQAAEGDIRGFGAEGTIEGSYIATSSY